MSQHNSSHLAYSFFSSALTCWDKIKDEPQTQGSLEEFVLAYMDRCIRIHEIQYDPNEL